jgi:hypothetical protein
MGSTTGCALHTAEKMNMITKSRAIFDLKAKIQKLKVRQQPFKRLSVLVKFGFKNG